MIRTTTKKIVKKTKKRKTQKKKKKSVAIRVNKAITKAVITIAMRVRRLSNSNTNYNTNGANPEINNGCQNNDTSFNYASGNPKQYWYGLMTIKGAVKGAIHPAPRPTLLSNRGPPLFRGEAPPNLAVWRMIVKAILLIALCSSSRSCRPPRLRRRRSGNPILYTTDFLRSHGWHLEQLHVLILGHAIVGVAASVAWRSNSLRLGSE